MLSIKHYLPFLLLFWQPVRCLFCKSQFFSSSFLRDCLATKHAFTSRANSLSRPSLKNSIQPKLIGFSPWYLTQATMSDTDDEDMKKAIALSLGQSYPTKPKAFSREPQAIIVLQSSDDETDDLDAPLTIKKKPPARKVLVEELGHVHSGISSEDGSKDEELLQKIGPPSQKLIYQINESLPSRKSSKDMVAKPGFLGLDRKKMEEERLLRIASKKKLDGTSLEPAEDSQKRKLANYSPWSQEMERRVKPKVAESNTLDVTPTVSSFKDQQALGTPGVQFPNGVVRKTWAYGYPRTDDIKIEEVLQKDTLDLAVLSSFQIEPEWVASKLNPSTKVIWVLQAKSEAEKENYKSQAPSNYRFCFPPMEGQINCMHSKLQLLAHPTHLRIVVPSANLVPYDWGETGVMENIVFIIDLPRLSEGIVANSDQLTNFGKELLYFLQAMGLEKRVVDSILKFDFSRTSNLAFVHSIGGAHSGASWKRTGFCGLATAVKHLGLRTQGALQIDVASSSIGNLNEGFIQSIYLAAQGDEGLTEYEWRTKKTARNKTVNSEERKLRDTLKENFRIYFPTRETVAQSKGGVGAGGTICLQSQWYNADSFPKALMCDCKSQRLGMLMHNKLLLVRQSEAADAGHAARAWGYLGSANLSESAWGKLVKDKITKEPKLNIKNWECGVIVLVPVISDAATNERPSKDGIGVFSGTIPVPMIVPGENYGRKSPWYFREQ
ncbi:tyrosyl-DNA phosphodiesterase-domain-containing protein [Bisporella sp. PMI_857]|nr:tyrosyl-DNA phosphodiesterase-domain-containing protein [Bisporella sp. PMI_857]